jgi:hypothetical protein
MTAPSAPAAGDERDRSKQRQACTEPHALIVAHVKPRLGQVHHRHIGPASPDQPAAPTFVLLAVCVVT